jgi:predicted dehydrogenase
MTHLIGLLFFVTGLRAERVHSVMRNHGLNVDLVDAFMIEFEGGAIAAIGGTGNNIQEARKIDLQVYCADGWIDIDEAKGTAIMQGGSLPREEYTPPAGVEHVVPSSITTDNLVDVVLGRAKNGSPGEVGWRAVEVLDAAYRSAAKGGEAVTVASLYE